MYPNSGTTLLAGYVKQAQGIKIRNYINFCVGCN